MKKFILKRIRMIFFKRKIFIGTYWNNEISLRQFIADRNLIILHIDRGTDKIIKFDFKLNSTIAQKKTRKFILIYAENNFITRSLGFTGNIAEKIRIGK